MAKIQIENWTLDVPDKKYFTIGEVSQLCDLKTHVLRYWEKEFPMLKPVKRSGRRYYQHKDIKLILEIKYLLHEQKYTIDGAVKRLSKRHLDVVEALDQSQVLRTLESARQQLKEHIAWLEAQKTV